MVPCQQHLGGDAPTGPHPFPPFAPVVTGAHGVHGCAGCGGMAPTAADNASGCAGGTGVPFWARVVFEGRLGQYSRPGIAPITADRTRSSARPHPFPPFAPVVTGAHGANGCAGSEGPWEAARRPSTKPLSHRPRREYPVYAQRELLDFPVRELLGTVYSLKLKQHHSRAEVAPCSTTRRDGAKPRSDES